MWIKENKIEILPKTIMVENPRMFTDSTFDVIALDPVL